MIKFETISGQEAENLNKGYAWVVFPQTGFDAETYEEHTGIKATEEDLKKIDDALFNIGEGNALSFWVPQID